MNHSLEVLMPRSSQGTCMISILERWYRQKGGTGKTSLVCYAEILVYENWELSSSTHLPKTQQPVGLDAR